MANSHTQEAFGTIVASGDKLIITPPHGILSRREYVFDRARQTVTIADKKFFIMGSKRSHLFEHLVFRMSAFGTEAHRCIEMQCRMPGKPLFVYRLTGVSADEAKLISARQVITDATGIKRWEN